MDRRSFLSRSALAGALPAASPREQSLVEAFDAMEIVDSHEHLLPEEARVAQHTDFFTLAGHYAMNDVTSAGLPAESLARINSPETPLAERWRLFEPYWNHARFTGYGQALRTAIQDIYDFPVISGQTLPAINAAIQARNKPGLYRYVMKERAKIRFAVVDDNYNAAPAKLDPEFFRVARKFDRFIAPGGASGVRAAEKLTDVSIVSLSGLKQAAEKSFQQSLEVGMVAVKSTLAYSRELRYHEVSEADASRDFDALLRGERKAPAGFRAFTDRPFRQLEDHMFHHVMKLAEAHGLPVQIHTGLTAGNGGWLTNSNPTHLTNLFYLFPKVRFDLFHIGYPYQGELSVLGKLFPNVFVDFCWVHVISPAVACRTLHDYLETIPVNKIFAFGGDYRFPELTYAHAKMARRNVARVLAEKVQEGFCTEKEALEIGALLLRDNAGRFFEAR
ncbi:MAG: amidohydrolase family protein [Acidobacteria bacterium]|nr:amidohydrolase family protein [Acidobacteriota bacterium]